MFEWASKRRVNQQGRPVLLASAALIKQSRLRVLPEQREWQSRAWEYFDSVGELRFSAQWISSALSRCELHVRSLNTADPRSEPLGLDEVAGADHQAKKPLDELFSGLHSEMLGRFAAHLTVAGESYLVGWESDSGRRWLVASSDEIRKGHNASQILVRLPESDAHQVIELDTATVIRLWRPHPRRAWEADCPVRAALPVLKELVELSAHVSATVESRLAGAGVLFMPESAMLPAQAQAGEELHEDPTMAAFIDAIVTPIQDRDNASAVVPIIVRVPDSATAKPQHLTFSTPFDTQVQSLRESAIRRFATVVDIPAEVLTGTAEANRWNAWKISEDAIRIHLEPLLGTICDGLTTKYLWPALEQMGVENPHSYVIWYDASDLIQRPNLGPEAVNLHELGLVKDRTVRESSGFTEDDEPDQAERDRRLLHQLASKGIDPMLVQPYLSKLGIEIDVPTPAAASERGTDIMGRPALPRRLPTRPDALPAHTDSDERRAVTASASLSSLERAFAELAALRALELAGKRLLNNNNRAYRGTFGRVVPWELHTKIPCGNADYVLSGAYNLLEHCLPDHPILRGTIDTYVRERLSTQQPHDPDRLMDLLSAAGCLPVDGECRAIA